MLTASHIQTALKAAGAGPGLVMPAADIAKAFNDAILTYGDGQFTTKEAVAALVSECMMESAYFRTTEEYNKKGRYAPFIGRTFIQITWHDNYLDFGRWCFSKGLVPSGTYFVDNPKKLSELTWVAIGGVWYFTQVKFHGKPLTDYATNIDHVGKAVNLGNPFSSYVPAGHEARRAAYYAVARLGTSIIPKFVDPVPPVTPVTSVTPVVEPPTRPAIKNPYSKTWKTEYLNWRGGNFAPITVAKLLAIPTTVRITQGGLSFAKASAKTHAGIGAGDLNTDGMTKDEVWNLCRELWSVNIIPCPRGFSADSFQGKTISNTNDGNEHIHFLDLDSYDSMHPEAQAQCREILNGGDGLQGNRSFVGPSRSNRKSWISSPLNPDTRPGGVYIVAVDELLGLDEDRNPKKGVKRQKGYEVTAARVVDRWGRANAVTDSETYYAIFDKTQIYMEEKK